MTGLEGTSEEEEEGGRSHPHVSDQMQPPFVSSRRGDLPAEGNQVNAVLLKETPSSKARRTSNWVSSPSMSARRGRDLRKPAC